MPTITHNTQHLGFIDLTDPKSIESQTKYLHEYNPFDENPIITPARTEHIYTMLAFEKAQYYRQRRTYATIKQEREKQLLTASKMSRAEKIVQTFEKFHEKYPKTALVTTTIALLLIFPITLLAITAFVLTGIYYQIFKPK